MVDSGPSPPTRPSVVIRSLLLATDARTRRGADAVDDNLALLVLRAVVVDLAAVVDDDAACRHRLRALRIELLAGADPPGSGDHNDHAVVRMEVRAAERVRRKAVANRVGTGLRRITVE